MGDLGFDIHLGGRASKPLYAEALRELTEADLALLATERHIQPSHVQRLSDRHHALARCIATGMKDGEAGMCTGYTPSRISILRSDPAFEELIAFYRADKGALVHDLADKMASIAKDTADILHDRLTDSPEKFSTGELQEQLKITADRTGHGPSAKTTVNVNLNLGDRLKSARERATSGVSSLALGSSGSDVHASSPASLLIEGKVLP